MVSFPNAKINLGLSITGKRADGYHNILSCFLPVPLCDILEINENSKTEFVSTGIEIPGKIEENLCLKAFELLKKDYELPPVKIHLHKIIPIGAGLGGGSSDGAFTLKMLNQQFNLFLNDDILEEYAAQLGSDCTFFIRNEPAIVKGRGDEFEPAELNLKGWKLVLVNPAVHVSTPAAYKMIIRFSAEKDYHKILQEPVEKWKQHLINDFERPIFHKFPEIGDLKQQMLKSGAVYCSMSGSGATVFGLFPECIDLKETFSENYQCWQFEL
jgi:4-diphosphocytidyl-2-C-methyl-D-erythritol kinase